MTTQSILTTYMLSDKQRAAALARGRDVAVTAGAGTGKTRTLVARYLSLLEDGHPARSIVAMTFTRKAAREMRNRIRDEIRTYLRQPELTQEERDGWQAAYDELDAARIGTIHTLCAEILRTHPAEARRDPRFDVLDETQSALFKQEAAEVALSRAVADVEMARLFALVGEQGLQKMLVALLNKRLEVVELMEAAPAPDMFEYWQAQLKRLTTEAIARFLADPDVAAARQTLDDNTPLDPDDLIGAQTLRIRAAFRSLEGETVRGKIRNLACLNDINKSGGRQASWPEGKEQLQLVKDALETLRTAWRAMLQPLAGGLNDQDRVLADAMPALYDMARIAFEAYEARRAERSALDFDDLEAGAIDLLAANPAVAAHWQDQVRALLVDEFQDTNARQLRLVRLLCPEPGKLFVVGDAKQSIYRFRGADVSVFNEERRRIGDDGGLSYDLDTSYRAHARLLGGLNDLLRPLMGEDEPGRSPWVAPFAPLQAGTNEVRGGLAEPFVAVQVGLGERASDARPVAARALARELETLVEQTELSYGDVAILCRASGSFAAYEDALDVAGIPYLTVAGKGFYERPEIRDLLNALRALADPHDDLALAGLLRSPACGLSDAALFRLVRGRSAGQTLWASILAGNGAGDAEGERLAAAVALIASLHQQTGRTSVAGILAQFLDRTQYRAILRRAGELRALRNVSKLLADIYASQLVSINRFLEYAQALGDSGSREGEARATAGGAVQIMTIHAAKGLEFPVVVLGDAGRGSSGGQDMLVERELGILLSKQGADKQRAVMYEVAAKQNKEQEEAESNRTLYVALTRAEQLLIINSYATLNKNGSLRTDGWLRDIAGLVPLSDHCPDDLEGGEAAEQTVELTIGRTPVRVSFHLPEPVPEAARPQTADATTMPEVTLPESAFPLLAPLPREESAPAEPQEPERVRDVLPRPGRPRSPSPIIGEIVHDALALWRFPDETFAPWATARGRHYRLNHLTVTDAVTRTVEMLRRFQQTDLFREMNGAERRLHELPISILNNDGRPATHRLDSLYRQEGRWTIVDFKTDEIHSLSGVPVVMRREGYDTQILRYGTAVHALLDERPRLLLCFLDVAGQVVLREMVGESGSRVIL